MTHVLEATWSPCWLFFVYDGVSTLLLIKQELNFFTGWGTQWGEIRNSCGQVVTGKFIVIMHLTQSILHAWHKISWRNIASHRFLSKPTILVCSFCLLSVSKGKIVCRWKSGDFRRWRIFRRLWRNNWRLRKRTLHAGSRMEETMKKVCEILRLVVWRSLRPHRPN